MATEKRERWASRTAFLMAGIGSAVGLGNFWRFPAQAFQNGGGAFLIPYFIALISTGIPLMIVEFALGQKYQGGAPQALAAVTQKFRWVGWFALLVATVICTYYVVVMAYAWHYCAASFSVAWTKPVPFVQWEVKESGDLAINDVPAEQVRVCLLAPNAGAQERMSMVQAGKPEQERLQVFTREQLDSIQAEENQKPIAKRVYYTPLDKNVANYFTEECLGGFRPGLWGALRESEGARPQENAVRPGRAGLLAISPNLMLGALLTWLMIFFIIFRGVRNVGRVVMLTVPLPIILILILMVRGLTLPGAATGMLYYLKPDWEMLRQPSVWLHAYGQVFFSLSLGFGILIAYASYMPPDSDVTNSAVITCFADAVSSFLAGVAVFSVLGYLAYIHNTPVKDVVGGGPGLVFVTYPIALAEMPMAKWAIVVLSLLFFVCLVSLGIDSAFSLVEGMVTGFRDQMPWLSKPVLTAIFCALGFLGSLFICTRSGLMWLDILDNWMNNYGLPIVALLECIAVGYFFHLDELKAYINRHSEIKVHYWFDAFVKFVTPAVLIVLVGQQFLTDITQVYGGYDKVLPHAVTVAGWGVFLAIFLIALVLGRNWRILAWSISALILTAGLYLYFRLALPEAQPSEVAAPAVMGAVGIALLFGGLFAGIFIALKTHHKAGLSPEAVRPEQDEGRGK